MGLLFKIFILSVVVAAVYVAKDSMASTCSDVLSKTPSTLMEKADRMSCEAIKDYI